MSPSGYLFLVGGHFRRKREKNATYEFMGARSYSKYNFRLFYFGLLNFGELVECQ